MTQSILLTLLELHKKGHIEIVFWQIVVQKVFEICAPSHFLIPPPTVFSSEANAHVGYST